VTMPPALRMMYASPVVNPKVRMERGFAVAMPRGKVISPRQVRISVLQLCIPIPVPQLAAHAGVAAFILLILFHGALASILIRRFLNRYILNLLDYATSGSFVCHVSSLISVRPERMVRSDHFCAKKDGLCPSEGATSESNPLIRRTGLSEACKRQHLLTGGFTF